MNPPVLSAAPVLLPVFPPAWAEVFGEDDAGLFAEFTLKEVRFVWRWIPPGRFLMGCDPADEHGYDDEKPQHEVTVVRGFWLGESPVTQAQWQALRTANPSHFKGDERPVEQVNWSDCMKFARALNAAVFGLAAGLPSEAQWEYACRAGINGAFPGGLACTQPKGLDPALDRLGWFDRNSGSETHPVKQKQANTWGLYDMHGNVWEWCLDVWESNAYASRVGGATGQESESSDLSNPPRVVRGGSWDSMARVCRAAFRRDRHPGNRDLGQGFRLAAGLELQAAEPPGAERLPPERRSRG